MLLDSAGNILPFYCQGQGNARAIRYASENTALTGGTALTETVIDLSPWVPPVATAIAIHVRFYNTAVGNSGIIYVHLRWVSGQDYFVVKLAVPASTLNSVVENSCSLPNYTQRIIYLKDANPGITTNNVDLLVPGYEYTV